MAKKQSIKNNNAKKMTRLAPTKRIGQQVAKVVAKFRQYKVVDVITTACVYVWSKRWLRILILCSPIVIYYLPLLLTGNNESPGDPDYYIALYEGFRKTVLVYHQFPWWDPWIAGGVPLFGNIQFGLISISSPLVLLFGAPMGLKLSLLIYGFIAFFGMKRLLMRYFQSTELRAIALAYVFTFCGYFEARAYMGHFTFPLAAFTPWAVYYYLYIHERRAWLKFAVVMGLLIDTAPHYTAIMTVYVLGILFIIETVRLHRLKSDFSLTVTQRRERFIALIKAVALFVILTGYRMFFVVEFFKDYQRALDVGAEKFTTLQNAFIAMWGSPNFVTSPYRGLTWGWGEIETYIGIGTLVGICLILLAWILYYRKNFRPQFSRSIVTLFVVFILFLLLGMGDFSRLSPYALAQYLPLFSAMRVATRWIFWDACIVLLILAAYRGRKFGRTITLVCLLAAIELLIRYPVIMSQAYFLPTYQYRSATAPFYQERYNRVPRPAYAHDKQFQQQFWFDQNLYESTKNNVGEPLASDSLLYKTYLGATYRCQYLPNRIPCPFVTTNNARITYWSPNHIKLVRTGPGEIKLDMNPGDGWRVNNTYPFGVDKSVTATAYFQFGNDNAKTYDIVYAPKLTPSWMAWKINQVENKL